MTAKSVVVKTEGGVTAATLKSNSKNKKDDDDDSSSDDDESDDDSGSSSSSDDVSDSNIFRVVDIRQTYLTYRCYSYATTLGHFG